MDVSTHGFKIMGMIRSMIRGYDPGYDSRNCNMHVVINFVYAISGNAHIGLCGQMSLEKFSHGFLLQHPQCEWIKPREDTS